jgi:hypothetical protein
MTRRDLVDQVSLSGEQAVVGQVWDWRGFKVAHQNSIT